VFSSGWGFKIEGDMNDSSKALSPELLLHIAKTLNVPMHGLVATIGLLDEGGTVPFIARYRKEVTGALDEVQIRDIEEKLGYFRDLVSRRETILASIGEQGKLTDELKAKIEASVDKSELEDLYLPYKPKRRTKATIAREKGLEPLALYVWAQESGASTLLEIAAGLVDEAKGVASVDEALEGGRHIVAEMIAETAELRKAARQEFPDLDLTVRGAISIARRLQDPLSELVKVDPKAIGVGQYQHDVDQRQLQQSLEATIESCVNKVGVDLNTSSWTLLRYIAGISERTALNIVQFRNENGRFTSRKQLMKVPGVGAKTFEQAAGFLRIRGGEQPLDSTAVHPESYAVVEQIAKAVGAGIAEVIANPALLDAVDKGKLAVGTFTLNDILEELRKPGRDPRDKFVAPVFHEGVKELSDLVPEMMLEGVVTNVTKFGAFVDIGVHQDGLVHISELSNRYVKDPGEVVKAGQIVKVRVLSVDVKSKRIALSMKTAGGIAPAARVAGPVTPKPQQAGGRGQQQGRGQQSAKVAAPVLTMEEKMAALSSRWKVR